MTAEKSIHINTIEELRCTSKFGNFFGVPQQVYDRVWQELSSPDGNSVAYISMEIGADPDVFHPVMDFLREQEYTKSKVTDIQLLLNKYLHGPRKIPNYSGGLGVLAGDTLKSFADTHIPVMAVSLLYREGYFSQIVDSKVGQIDQATSWSPEETPTLFQLQDPENPGTPLTITVPFFNEYDHHTQAKAQVWMKMEISEELDYFVPEFLLDYSIPSSPPWVREAGLRLYNSKSSIMKANQRRMLGSAVLPLMKALDLAPRTIHLNEQHGGNHAQRAPRKHPHRPLQGSRSSRDVNRTGDSGAGAPQIDRRSGDPVGFFGSRQSHRRPRAIRARSNASLAHRVRFGKRS